MKKYQNSFSCYGQSVASKIAYLQKMGIANGIINDIKHKMKNDGLDLNNWKTKTNHGDLTLTETKVTIIIPTKEQDWLDDLCPAFIYNGKIGLIDMLHFDDNELQFHIMLYDHETKSYKNGYWHTVREGLTLEQTCTLFEYITDILDKLIVLPSEDCEKYNSTGALIV